MLASLKERLLFSWSQLAECNTSYIVRSSYMWFVAIPICVNLLSKTESHQRFTIFGHTIDLVFSLPFSWVLFYFSSVAFAIGRSIYLLECPELIRRYPLYSDFNNDGRSNLLLKASYLDAVSTHAEWKKRISQFIERFRARPQLGQPINVDNFPWNTDLEASLVPDAYTFVRTELAQTKPTTRLLCSASFIAGTALFAATCVHSFVFVIQYIMG